jgi:hypothetical protein
MISRRDIGVLGVIGALATLLTLLDQEALKEFTLTGQRLYYLNLRNERQSIVLC